MNTSQTSWFFSSHFAIRNQQISKWVHAASCSLSWEHFMESLDDLKIPSRHHAPTGQAQWKMPLDRSRSSSSFGKFYSAAQSGGQTSSSASIGHLHSVEEFQINPCQSSIKNVDEGIMVTSEIEQASSSKKTFDHCQECQDLHQVSIHLHDRQTSLGRNQASNFTSESVAGQASADQRQLLSIVSVALQAPQLGSKSCYIIVESIKLSLRT